MWRVVLIFAAALVVADTTGALPECDDTECTDEGNGKQCPPTCPTCTCVWHTLKTAPISLVEMPPIDFTSLIVELPPVRGAHGRLAPAPITRPPIV